MLGWTEENDENNKVNIASDPAEIQTENLPNLIENPTEKHDNYVSGLLISCRESKQVPADRTEKHHRRADRFHFKFMHTTLMNFSLYI
jgi:hypothetical protein